MYYQITKLVYLLNLPEDIILHILHLAGYIRLRNGVYMNQINRNCLIYKQITMIPWFRNSTVQLFLETKWFRKSFCDKIITLKNVYNQNGVHDDYLAREFDTSWYEYDESNAQHPVKYEDHFITYDIDTTIDVLLEADNENFVF